MKPVGYMRHGLKGIRPVKKRGVTPYYEAGLPGSCHSSRSMRQGVCCRGEANLRSSRRETEFAQPFVGEATSLKGLLITAVGSEARTI